MISVTHKFVQWSGISVSAEWMCRTTTTLDNREICVEKNPGCKQERFCRYKVEKCNAQSRCVNQECLCSIKCLPSMPSSCGNTGAFVLPRILVFGWYVCVFYKSNQFDMCNYAVGTKIFVHVSSLQKVLVSDAVGPWIGTGLSSGQWVHLRRGVAVWPR